MRGVVLHVTHEAQFPGAEGVGVGGVGLGHVARAVDLIVEHDQYTLADRIRTAGEGHGVIQVDGPVGGDRGRRPHGANDHDRLSALDHEVQEVRGLLDGIRAVGDDDAVDVALREQLVDTFSELEPVLVVHVFAGDLEHLLALDVGDLFQFRDSLDQPLYADGGGLVTDGRGARCARAGDRASGRKDHHIG